MNVNMLIGFIAGIGLYTGVRMIQKEAKKEGMIELVFTFFQVFQFHYGV